MVVPSARTSTRRIQSCGFLVVHPAVQDPSLSMSSLWEGGEESPGPISCNIQAP